MAERKSKWKLVSEYPITDYKCGIRAGEKVRLRKDLVIRDHRGKTTGKVYSAGEIWMVLRGAAEPPLDVWLSQLDGKRHTWSDNDCFWEWFERVGEDAEGTRKKNK